jgi:hypothetical protein
MHLIFHVHGAWGQERPVLWAHNHHTIYGQLMGWRLYTELMGVNFIPNLKLSIFLISPFKIEERYNKLTLYWCVCVCVCVCTRACMCVSISPSRWQLNNLYFLSAWKLSCRIFRAAVTFFCSCAQEYLSWVTRVKAGKSSLEWGRAVQSVWFNCISLVT